MCMCIAHLWCPPPNLPPSKPHTVVYAVPQGAVPMEPPVPIPHVASAHGSARTEVMFLFPRASPHVVQKTQTLLVQSSET